MSELSEDMLNRLTRWTSDRIFKLNEESDRGSVIIAAAQIDSALESLIEQEARLNGLSRKASKKLFELAGPCSSFSAKALICYTFGLISKHTFNDVNILRRLRNEVAHTDGDFDFSDPRVVEQVMSMKCVSDLAADEGICQSARKLDGTIPPDWHVTGKGKVQSTKLMFLSGVTTLRFHLKMWEIGRRKRPDASGEETQ